jgi:hypothetical protein
VVETFLDGLDTRIGRTCGQCLEQYGAGEPYLPLLDAIGRLCRDPTQPGALAALQRSAPTWVAALPGLTTALARATAAPSRTRMLLSY